MSFVHGKNTFVSLDGVNISTATNNTTFERNADTHDVTTYGKDSHVYSGGLKNGTVNLAGFYDSTAVTGSAAVLRPMVGETVPYVFRPEGTGSGKPQATVDVVVTKYVETAPVADMVTWSADLQLSDDINDTPQSP